MTSLSSICSEIMGPDGTDSVYFKDLLSAPGSRCTLEDPICIEEIMEDFLIVMLIISGRPMKPYIWPKATNKARDFTGSWKSIDSTSTNIGFQICVESGWRRTRWTPSSLHVIELPSTSILRDFQSPPGFPTQPHGRYTIHGISSKTPPWPSIQRYTIHLGRATLWNFSSS